jgi:hypothetical protein
MPGIPCHARRGDWDGRADRHHPTDGAPPGPRTGLIVGQVLDAGTGAPVGEAIVRLTMPKYFNNPTAPNGRVMADGEGRFFFADLPAGEYYLQATKEAMRAGSTASAGPGARASSCLSARGSGSRTSSSGCGSTAVIAGTVVDEAGEPVVGVAVRALIKNVVAGRPQFGNMEVIPELVPATITDDRGMFRLPQLMPGPTSFSYPPRRPRCRSRRWTARTPGGGASSSPRASLEVAPLGQPRTQQTAMSRC